MTGAVDRSAASFAVLHAGGEAALGAAQRMTEGLSGPFDAEATVVILLDAIRAAVAAEPATRFTDPCVRWIVDELMNADRLWIDHPQGPERNRL